MCRRVVFFLVLVCVLTVAAPVGAQQPKTGLGLLRSQGEYPRFAPSSRSLQSLPSAVDLSQNMPPVGNQGTQSSCVGWALGYNLMTSLIAGQKDWALDSPTHQVSPSWVYNQRNTVNCLNDWGMTYVDGFRILEQLGAAMLSDFPYNSRDTCTQPGPEVRSLASAHKLDSFANVFDRAGEVDLYLIKSILANGQPVAIGLPVYYPSFYAVTYAHPIVERPGPGDVEFGGHAMIIVGYDDSVGGFLTVNSWGSAWGRDGYCYLSYDFVQHDAFEGWIANTQIPDIPSVSLDLSEGWNLVSLPLVPGDSRPESVLSSIADDVASAYVWDAAESVWDHYAPDLPGYANSLNQLDPDQGIWLNMKKNTLLTLSGEVRDVPRVALQSGWNLVAYPGDSEMAADKALASIDGLYSLALGYDEEPQLGLWQTHSSNGPPVANTLLSMKPGHGYWIRTSGACEWSVPVD